MNYSGINAKIRAMKGFLFTLEQYEELAKNSSMFEIALKLRQQQMYKRAISGLDDATAKRFSIEQKIILSLTYEYERIYQFISDFRLKGLLDAYYLKHEIHLINTMLCSVYDKRSINYSESELSHMIGKKFQIDTVKLKESKNLEEFINNLNATRFYSVLSKVSKENKIPAQFEMQLDLYYYMNLWKVKNKLDKVNNLIVTKIIGTEIDLRNIIWIYRLKKYYKVEEFNIYAYLIPISYQLQNFELKKMVESKSIYELTSSISSCKYKDEFNDVLLHDSRIEAVFFYKMSKLLKKLEAQYPNSLVTAISYIYHKEVEIKNLISLIEGVKYKLEAKEIMKHLIL